MYLEEQAPLATRETATSPDMAETTFYLGPSGGQPFRWVGRITVANEIWSSGQEAKQQLEPLIVDLPPSMIEPLLGFARKHIGPNATERQVTYWCHHFAHTVGETALELTGNTIGGEWGRADKKARLLLSQGSRVSPDDLVLGEHAAVSDGLSKGPVHSLVSIGRSKADTTGPVLAVQVDGRNGNLYVGDPAAYLDDLRSSRAIYNLSSQPGLYVQRTPLSLPANS